MNTVDKIEKKDLRQISYQEFGGLLDILQDKIDKYIAENNVKLDLVVPILRSGAFPGMHLASKIGITNILPAQYKYSYIPQETIEKKIEFPKVNFFLPEIINILITDSNTMSGGIARKVISDVRSRFPQATLYFATVNLDQSIESFTDVKQIFYSVLSNERRRISKEAAEKRKITNEVLIFPWEDIEKQWEDINSFSSTSDSDILLK